MHQIFLLILLLWKYMSFQACPWEGPTRLIYDRTGHIKKNRNKEMVSERTNRRPKRGPQKTNVTPLKAGGLPTSTRKYWDKGNQTTSATGGGRK